MSISSKTTSTLLVALVIGLGIGFGCRSAAGQPPGDPRAQPLIGPKSLASLVPAGLTFAVKWFDSEFQMARYRYTGRVMAELDRGTPLFVVERRLGKPVNQFKSNQQVPIQSLAYWGIPPGSTIVRNMIARFDMIDEDMVLTNVEAMHADWEWPGKERGFIDPPPRNNPVPRPPPRDIDSLKWPWDFAGPAIPPPPKRWPSTRPSP